MGKLGEITIENINPTEFGQKKLENLGQYLDINFKVNLNKNSYEKEVTKEILASGKLNELQSVILVYLQKNYPDANFNLNDIKAYFNNFKSPYHDIKSSADSAKNVSYTSEHLNRYLTEEDWLSKYGNKPYKEAIYVNEDRRKNGDLIKFRIDNNHMGIDLSFGKFKNVYMTNFGKSYAFPQGSGNNGGLGNVVIVQHYISKDSNTYPLNIATVYAHLVSLEKSSADIIDGNNVIGKEGGTGRNPEYDSHLHLELWKIDDALASQENITSLASVRRINNEGLSYNYRYINATFQAFIDVTGSTGFKVFNDNQKNVEQKSTNTYTVLPISYNLNTYIAGNQNIQVKSILSFSKNFISNTNEERKGSYIYKYDINKNLYFDNYSLKNLNKKLSSSIAGQIENFETFLVQENRQIDAKSLSSEFEFKFKDYLDELGNTFKLSENDSSKEFGENMKATTSNDKKALFTFYFPIRLSIFKKNYKRKNQGVITNDEMHNINAEIKSSNQKNFFIRFKIFDILFMNKIFNIKYDKIGKKFNTKFYSQNINNNHIENYMFRNGEIPENYYEADIVYTKYDGDFLTFSNCNENKNYSLIFFEETRKPKINDYFQFKYSKKKYDSTYNYQNQLKIELYATNNLQDSFKMTDDFNNYVYKKFIENYTIPFGERWLNLDETDQKKNTNFTRSYTNFFNEVGNDSVDNISLPVASFSNEFDTINMVPKDLEIDLNPNENVEINNKNIVNITSAPQNKLILEKDFHPSCSLKCNPFVESIFFNHRIESSYLPKCIYETDFVATKKMRTLYDFRDNGKLCNYYFPPELREITKGKDLFTYSDGKYKEFHISDFPPRDPSKTITNIKETKEIRKYFQDANNSPVYTFYLNLNDLYFEIIYNMINIDIYNIED